MNILLVEPNFPFPNKSKNKANQIHKNFVPIGLLKFAALHKDKGHKVKLVRGLKTKGEIGFTPNEIYVTSIFTYWSCFVWDSIKHYRGLFPQAVIKLGGIYATLHSDDPKFLSLVKEYCVTPFKGICKEAEKYLPDYSVLSEVDYHATHMMRGCIRKCSFCGTWKLEPERMNKNKDEVIAEILAIGKNKVIFYDNNILANPHIKDILREFVNLKVNCRPVYFESQSGFDGRLLEADEELAYLISKSRFRNVRIAWDNGIIDKSSVKKQIDILRKVGYAVKDISIFMIYNFCVSYEHMLEKVSACKEWGVQIADCRYRPLEIDYDNYCPRSKYGQQIEDYYIHRKTGWHYQTNKEYKRVAVYAWTPKHNTGMAISADYILIKEIG